MPRTHALEHAWHETPNIHLCTIADFVALARETGAVIERAIALSETGRTRPMGAGRVGPEHLRRRRNLPAETALTQPFWLAPIMVLASSIFSASA